MVKVVLSILSRTVSLVNNQVLAFAMLSEEVLFSCWRGQRYEKTFRVPRLCQGNQSHAQLCIQLDRRVDRCAQEYRTTCLLGCETDTYDSEGKQVRVAPWHHVTREQVEQALEQFRGEIEQVPPVCVSASARTPNYVLPLTYPRPG